MHTKNLTQEAAVKKLQATKHDITFSQASTMVKRFKRFKKQLATAARKLVVALDPPKFPDSLAYNNAAIYRLMKSPGCIGIRIYPAIDDQHQFRLVLVGIDERGNNILPSEKTDNGLPAKSVLDNGTTGVLDEGQASPPFPPPPNDL